MYPTSAPQPSYPVPAVPAAPSAPDAAATRPRAAVLAVGSALAVGGLTVLTQLLGLALGRSAIEAELSDQLGPDAQAAQNLLGGLLTAAVDEAYATLRTRAVVGVVLALVVVVLAVAARRASLVARILLAVALVVSALWTVVVVADVFPATATLAGVAALLLTPVALVTAFLPPVNRYRTALRGRGTAPRTA